MDHLNIFNPYENKPLDHEDQITRALLILLKNAKPVELVFTDMIIEEMVRLGCKAIPKRLTESTAGVDVLKTQVWSATKNELSSASGRLVSVLVTDKKLEPAHRIERTGRVAVYDGIIHYKPDWIFVVENKPDHRNVWVDPMSSAFSESFEIEPQPVVLRWQDIIARISTIKENGLLPCSEAGLVDDFLDFVADKFPELNPYDRFGLCKSNKYLLGRRCISIMEDSELGPVDYHRGWRHYIELTNVDGAKEMALYTEMLAGGEWEVRLELYPGDTVNQARQFYLRVNPEQVLRLARHGWDVRPNFHLAFRSSNLVWTSVSCSLRDYLDYWIEEVRQNKLRQLSRNEWGSYFATLKKVGMLSIQDDPQMNKKIISTQMKKINVCPGVGFKFRWSQAEAIESDNKRAFTLSFKEKVKECIDTWRKEA